GGVWTQTRHSLAPLPAGIAGGVGRGPQSNLDHYSNVLPTVRSLSRHSARRIKRDRLSPRKSWTKNRPAYGSLTAERSHLESGYVAPRSARPTGPQPDPGR